MNVNMNTSASLAQYAGAAAGLTMLKKAMDIQAESALTLINAVQPPSQQQSASNLPPHLGQNINTTA